MRARADDVIKLIVALHSSVVESSDMHAILEGDTVVTFDDKQRCHHRTPLPKNCLSYLMSQDKQSITVTSCALAPVASGEHSRVTSCVSVLVHVAGMARVDRDNLDDEQSISITSGVSALACMASGEQDHVFLESLH